MEIPSARAAFLADIRVWARDPNALIFTVRGKYNAIAIVPEDVKNRTDEQMMAFIVTRCIEADGRRNPASDNMVGIKVDATVA
jgi:hypothetical protein